MIVSELLLNTRAMPCIHIRELFIVLRVILYNVVPYYRLRNSTRVEISLPSEKRFLRDFRLVSEFALYSPFRLGDRSISSLLVAVFLVNIALYTRVLSVNSFP